MEIKISEYAQKELDQGILYYELEQHGLGLRFKQEIRNSIDRIKKHHQAWPIERGEVRKCFVHKFPYKILYSVQKNSIAILTVSHQHRKPGYWMEK